MMSDIDNDNDIPDFFDIRFRALLIAGGWVFVGGAIGIAIHFSSKGLSFIQVPSVGMIAMLGVIAGLIEARRSRDVTRGGMIISIAFTVSMIGLAVLSDGLHSALLPMICGVPGFAALFWNLRGATWTLFASLTALGLMALAELFDVMPHNYFGPFPDLKAAGFAQSVFNSLVMVSGTGFFYVREQRAIKELIASQMRKAQSGEKARAKFIANMTHELRMPLNGISGLAALALKETDQAAQMDYLRSIQHSVRELDILTEHVLMLSIDEQNTDTEIVNLEEFIAVGSQWPIENRSDYQIVEWPNQSVLRILRLLSHASITRQPGAAHRVVLANSAEDFRIIVYDFGAPLNESTFAEMTKSFERAQLAGEFRSNTALGLSVACDLAKFIGGWIEMQRKPDQAFVFCYPRALLGANSRLK